MDGLAVLRCERGMTEQTEAQQEAREGIELPFAGPVTLGCGSDTGTTVCVTKGNEAFLSQKLADLSQYESYREFETAIGTLKGRLGVEPAVVAHDLHPDYASTRYAMGMTGVELEPVQHHHAHLAACMVENGVDRKTVGVAFDGMGLGADGTLWGGEFLVCDLLGFERAAHLKQYGLPGGDQATLNPERVAFSCILAELDGNVEAALRLLPGLDPAQADTMARMLRKGLRSPLTSSAGRLFDAVSALLGFRGRVSFSGEAAIALQSLAGAAVEDEYGFTYAGDILDFGPMIREIVSDLGNGVDRGRIAGMFHNTLAAGAAHVCEHLAGREGARGVAVSGGVFLNGLLRARLTEELQNRGLEVYTHSLLSPGDACISLGQAAVAMARRKGT